jgi:hypothetical protein
MITSRRPAVNPIPVGGGNTRDEEAEKIGCPRCSIVMVFSQDFNRHICCHCGYGISPDRLKELQQQEQQPTKKNKTKVVTADVAETVEPDNNIPLASKESRVEESKKRHHDPYRGKLDKDDLRYIAEGATLVSFTEHFSDDHTTMSGTELERERQRRNNNVLRIKGKRLL